MRAVFIVLLLAGCCTAPHKHYPTRNRCQTLSVLPNPATSEDKDAWIDDTTNKYMQCAKSRRVFMEPK